LLSVLQLALEVLLVVGGLLVHQRRLQRAAAGLSALALVIGALMATVIIYSKVAAMQAPKEGSQHWVPTTDAHDKDWVTLMQLSAVFTVVTSLLHLTLAFWAGLLARCYGRSPLSPQDILQLLARGAPLEAGAIDVEAGTFNESLVSPESETFARAYESRLADEGPVFTHNLPVRTFR
jgi:hypothetical protein